eukprot:303426-Prymnesium_polylepis.1
MCIRDRRYTAHKSTRAQSSDWRQASSRARAAVAQPRMRCRGEGGPGERGCGYAERERRRCGGWAV